MRERGGKRRTSGAGRVGLALAALLLAAAGPGAAQEAAAEKPRVSVTVRGVAGPILRGRPGRFLPVNVVLENLAGRAQDGLLRVYRSDRPRSSSAELGLYYERRVTLPAGARRVETVYYYCQEDEVEKRLVVAYQPDDGVAPEPSFPPFELETDRLSVLILSSREASEAEQVFRAAEVAGPREVLRVTTTVADLTALPDHMAGYDPFDAVVVTDLNQGDIPADRLAPLLEWVAAGNDLIVAFDGKSNLPTELRAALPVTRGAARSVDDVIVDLRAMGRGVWPGAEPAHIDEVLPAPGADVLAGVKRPLVVRGAWGAGRVTYLAFPLDAAAIRNRWGGLRFFGGQLLRAPRSQIADRATPMLAPPLEELLLNLSGSLATLSSPSALLVAPLLVLYVLLVSPLNYMFLARRRRLGLSQPLAALVVLAFGALFFAMDRLYAGQPASTQIAVREVPSVPLDAPKGGPSTRGRVDTLSGYYSAREGLVSAGGPPGAALTPLLEKGGANGEGRVIQRPEGAALEQLTVVTKALRRFRSLRADEVGRVELDLALEGSVVKGTIRNGTGAVVDDALLLLPQGLIELPRLPADRAVALGGTGLISWDDVRPDPLELVRSIRRDAIQGYPALYGSDGSSLAGIQVDPYAGSVPRRLVDMFRRRLLRVHGAPGKLPALIVGRVSQDPGGIVVDGLDEPALARSYVVVETSVTLRGYVELRGLEPVVYEKARDGMWQPIDGATGSPAAMGGSVMNPAIVTFAWTLPSSIDAPLRVDQLRLRWSTTPPIMIPESTILEVWNGRLNAFVPVFDLQKAERNPDDGLLRWTAGGDLLKSAPADLVDPSSGSVLMRLVNQGVDFRIDRLVLDASGTREKQDEPR